MSHVATDLVTELHASETVGQYLMDVADDERAIAKQRREVENAQRVLDQMFDDLRQRTSNSGIENVAQAAVDEHSSRDLTADEWLQLVSLIQDSM